jgi:hypothetical protein
VQVKIKGSIKMRLSKRLSQEHFRGQGLWALGIRPKCQEVEECDVKRVLSGLMNASRQARF